MKPDELKYRTKQYALRIIRVAESAATSFVGRHLSGQLLRSGTSVGANYRAACRAKSRADFISKLGTVEEECDESLFWMELLTEANLVKPTRLRSLMHEGEEILSIVVASANTARKNAARNGRKS